MNDSRPLLETSHIPSIRSPDYPYLAASLGWSVTFGAALSEASVAQVSPLVRTFSCLWPLATWMILPFKPFDGITSTEMSSTEKISRIAVQALGVTAGFFALYLLNREKINEDKLLFIALQMLVISVNLLCGYTLRQRPNFSEKISHSAVVGKIVNFFKKSFTSEGLSIPQQQEATQSQLKTQTDTLFKEIAKIKTAFQIIQDELRNNTELHDQFNILISQEQNLAKKYKGTPVNNPTIEAWRRAAHEASYWRQMKTCFLDFLNKHPELKSKLADKLFNQEEKIEGIL